MIILPLTAELLDQCYDSFVATLSSLSKTGDLTLTQAQSTLQHIQQSGSHIRVAYDPDKTTIVGTITLLLEPVFWRGGSYAGHIENVVVHPDYQGKGIAKSLITTALETAKSHQCYKVILDCSDDLVMFYEKFGFKQKEIGMKVYFA